MFNRANNNNNKQQNLNNKVLPMLCVMTSLKR